MNLFRIRLAADALLLFLLIYEMADRFTGNFAHEAAGIAILGAALLHLALNRRWWRAALGRGLSRIPKGKLACALVLPVSFAVSWGTGVLISQSVFADFIPEIPDSDLTWRVWHVASSLWCFVFAGIHAGLHWDVMKGAAGKRLRPLARALSESHPGRALLRAIGLAALLFWAAVAARALRAWFGRELTGAALWESSFFIAFDQDTGAFFSEEFLALFFGLAWAAALAKTFLRKLPSGGKKP